MAHAKKVKWKDFYDNGLGPNLPLPVSQQVIPISGVLPSGESNSFDPTQYHDLRFEATGAKGSGINFPFPYPNQNTNSKYKTDGNSYTTEWWETSGILKTYPPNSNVQLVDEQKQSGVFHYNLSRGRFSNGEDVKSKQIDDFNIFNQYIHHQLMPSNLEKGNAIKIPYVSTYRLSIDWNPYG